MNILSSLSISIITILITIAILFKNSEAKPLLIKILSIILLSTFVVRLFSADVDSIYNVFNILLTDITTPINSPDTWLFSPLITILIIIFRWFGVALVVWITTAILYPGKYLKPIISYFGIVIGILNIFFINYHLIAIQGTTLMTYQTVQFMVETALILSISLIYLLDNYKVKFSKTIIINYLLIIFGTLLAVMPLTLLYNLFGNYGIIPKDMNFEHILVIITPAIVTIIIYKLIKNKEQSTKEATILILALASVIQFFYFPRYDLAALPFHLCNAAIILIVIAVTFKIKSLFYFAYFANIIGALGGLILPNYESDLYTLQVIHFLYNHWLVLIIPILAVAVGVFEKPKLKHMYYALVVFTAYFILVIFLNAWFNNYTSVDYFFAYSDFLPELFNLERLRLDYVITFSYKDLTFTFYWLFQLIYYLSFMGLMFVSWYVYDVIYNAIDKNRRLRIKQRQMKVDMNLLIELLDGKKLNERISEESKGMIKIKNFSKKYGKSKHYAVKNFSLDIEPGEILGFLGHNGAGKSTTIKSMVGIQSITEGDIIIDGYSIKTQPIEAKLQIGYVSDNHAVYEKLTGREYINYVADLYKVGVDIREERFNKLLKNLNLEHAIDEEVKSYSHGMKQKLVVIASLIHEPKIWILDEPLTGLDPTSAFEIKEAMKEHSKKGNIVFFSSHVIEVIEKVCTKIAVINKGELVGVFDVGELRDKGISLETLYFQGE